MDAVHTNPAQRDPDEPKRRPQLSRWRLAALGAFGVAGALFVTTSLNAGGLDLRESSVTDLDHVVRQERERVEDMAARIERLEAEVNALSEAVDDRDVRQLQRQAAALQEPAGFTAVHGPGLTVTLDDVPREERQAVLDAYPKLFADALVIHQQDIQAVVNALWAGGAEAMTIKDVRIISTTGIRCVGNVVILHGVPYSPPYTIRAIGDPDALRASLASNEYVGNVAESSRLIGIGYEVEENDDLEMPPYAGQATLKHAEQAAAPVERD